MARTIPPLVHLGVVCGLPDELQPQIAVGTPLWYEWLAGSSKFAFASDSGTFTAYKERQQRGDFYWKAYRRRKGKLYRAYLGKSERLTLERMDRVAQQLAGQIIRVPALPLHEEQATRPSARSPANRATVRPTPRQWVQDPTWDPLLTTKLHIPAAGQGLVPRARLTEQIDLRPGRRLTLICAPAGFGKTTLLSEWSARRQGRVAWVSLDAGDNDAIRFWRALLTALETSCSGTGAPALALLRGGPAPPIESLLTFLINALDLLRDDLALVLDDYQAIQAAPIHQGLTFLLEHAPACLHLIIASREDPPLPLARWRVQEQVTELHAADLRFTPEEAHTFFSKKGDLDLTAEEITTLAERTEGWVAGLQLAALSLRAQQAKPAYLRAFANGTSRFVADYLLSEVLQQQPEPVQTFLMQTAILERLCGPLCDAVTVSQGGQALLERLERANLLLVPLDGEQCWYRYHHLFAEFLRARQRHEQPEQTARLHSRAAAWYERQNLPAEAIHHALAAADFLLAARLIEQIAEPVAQRGELITLRHWLDALPDATVRKRLRLCLVQARALVTSGQMEVAEGLLQQAEQTIRESPDPLSAEHLAQPPALLGEIAAIRAEIGAVQGDLPRAIALSLQALEELPLDQSFLRASVAATLGTIYVAHGDMTAGINAYALSRAMSFAGGNLPAVVGSLASQGYLQLLQGQLSAAAATFQEALTIAMGQELIPPLACLAYVGLGKVLYEKNELDAASVHLQRGLELGQQRGDTVVVIRSLTTLARIKQVLGARAGAGVLMQQVDELARTARSPAHRALAAISVARLALVQGDLEPASSWAEASGLTTTDPLSYQREFGHLTLARVLLAQERLEAAAELLERLCVAAERAGRGERLLEGLVLQALTFQAQGARAAALAVLAHALTLGEAGGYLRLFLDEGEPLRLLLAKLWRVQRHPSARQLTPSLHRYLSTLLAASPPEVPPGGTAGPAAAARRQRDLLSQREREILRLMTEGKSNQEIAAVLVIEPTTVMWHLKQLFSKLDVHSRTQAIARARALGLL